MRKDDVEKKIQQIIDSANQKGIGIPTQVSEIGNFPYSDFDSLLADFQVGNARLLRFSFAMQSSLFSIIASPGEKFVNTFGLFVIYGGVVASMVTSYLFYWWLLILIPIFYIIGSSLVKKSYNNAIFESSFSSELLFCFLYFYGQISVAHKASSKQYYYKIE